ncbi:MAG: hypothetical protein KAI70_05470 [Candidatus Omnitrophica bacterium]|nr:hypothetical protein [Candidatus Omnitrophota bacterium]
MKTYYVYIHRRKDNNRPFYIGCATNQGTKNTSRGKYSRAYDVILRRPRWFEVREEAGGLCVEIFFETTSHEKAYAMEKKIVDLYGREKFNNGLLVNECKGGIGAPGQFNSEKTKRKKSITKLGHLNPQYGKHGFESSVGKHVMNTVTKAKYGSIMEAARQEGLRAVMLYQYLDSKSPLKNHTNLVRI